ncbi:MAG: FtsX-like permease family protein [Lachnospiraceae bacterium]|nr:FtsX-like permease family protein [Lachnospiraceae bacterium]
MSIMFRNSNAALEKELAAEDYRAHPVRNRLAILAVALCAVMIIITFSVGIGLAQTVSRSMGASPGPGADSASLCGDEEILGRIREQPQVEWAAYVRRCSSTRLHNREFNPLDVYLLAADEVHYDKNMVDLIVGSYPEQANEILLSDTISERLGLEQQVEISYSLKVVVERGGEQVEQEIPMTVCGYYRNPIRNCADIYEEIYTSDQFIDTYNPELPGGYDTIYVKLNNLNPLKFGHDTEKKLSELNEIVEANGTSYKMSDMTLTVIIPVILIVACIMLCGYFFIYNIFDISIVNDIRFYGELKTIGMSSRQLRRMLLWQMNRIAFYGIVIGGLAGSIIGQTASGQIVGTFAENIAMYYQPAGAFQTFLLGGVFAWITLLISTLKPFRVACMISPVEAARYRAKRKKGVFSVLSFALSGMLFLIVYTVAIGFSVEAQIDRRRNTDFQIRHKGIMWSQNEPFEPISSGLVERLQDLEFAEDLKIYYIGRTKPDYFEMDGLYWYTTSAEITAEGEIARDQIAYVKSQLPDTADEARAVRLNERGNLSINVVGMEAGSLEEEMRYNSVLEGSIDEKKFEDGGYMIYLRSFNDRNEDQDKGMEYAVHAGDEVSVTFYDDVADRYVDKKFTVMAVIMNQDTYGAGNVNKSNIWLTQEAFKSIYSDYENLVGAITFNGADYAKDGSALSEQEKQEGVEQVLQEDGNLQLMLDSVYQNRLHFTEMKRTITVFGMFLSVLVGLIGIANIINTVTTDVIARKVEYAAMQSIGMTGTQMQSDIFRKYAVYIFTALGLATVTGTALSYMIGSSVMFNFSWVALVQAVLIFLCFSVLLCVVMARVLTRVMNRKSIVERLREVV